MKSEIQWDLEGLTIVLVLFVWALTVIFGREAIYWLQQSGVI